MRIERTAEHIFKRTRKHWGDVWRHTSLPVRETLLESAVLTDLMLQDDSIPAYRRLERAQTLLSEVRELLNDEET